jgi:2-Cys peroxiredoxin 5
MGRKQKLLFGTDILQGPACSSTHVPGFINHPKLKEAGQAFVISVNDPFV